ncbi:unnamed protein product [Acanthoscelides obtectus]|uniref:Uncharacterized protein n=1 Tax=Acanthoscelides obtectus TaxID=200917 RepID=A0A9P0K9Y9_ACAOB|nr:unnamed protein product [Acanthoscelides obtectus]CAK1680103.1 hypothetical protein AOBTE_LOCUS32507 [Acanthoscelides obtectus]
MEFWYTKNRKKRLIIRKRRNIFLDKRISKKNQETSYRR